jgi:Ca2+-binding RTX toxin-like protein
MAVFTVPNGTGLNGNGIQFGTLSQIAAPGVAGIPFINQTFSIFFFNDPGQLEVTGTGMSFTLPNTFGGTVDSLTYNNPAATPIFTITGMSTPLADVASGFLTPGGELAALAIIFSGNDTITGSTQADRLYGFDGIDTINGGAGDDTLRGGAGGDTLNGGAGSDFANYQGSSAEVFVDIQSNLLFSGDATGDVLNSIENLYGSSFSDTLSGDAGRNIIGGEGGADLIDGRAGDDALSGEAGDDILNGRDGADRLVGGDGTDRLSGGTGNHILEGGAGADTLTGGNGIDTASYASSAAGVTVVLGGASSGGDAQGDTLTAIEQVMGSGFADSITGDAGANTLWGLAGDDVLTGGGGADTLKGGAGNDRFVYLAIGDSTVAAAGRDTITDFSTGDKIDLSAIDANGAGPGDAAFTFGNGAFTAAGQVRVLDFGGGRYGVYLETTGNNVEDSVITVYSDHALTAADFVL